MTSHTWCKIGDWHSWIYALPLRLYFLNPGSLGWMDILESIFLRRLEVVDTGYRRIASCRAALFPLNRINTSARSPKKGNPSRIHPHLDSHLMVSHRSNLILQRRHHRRFDSFMHCFARLSTHT